MINGKKAEMQKWFAWSTHDTRIERKMSDSKREDYVAQAKLAEQAERYDDMAAAMKLVRRGAILLSAHPCFAPVVLRISGSTSYWSERKVYQTHFLVVLEGTHQRSVPGVGAAST